MIRIVSSIFLFVFPLFSIATEDLPCKFSERQRIEALRSVKKSVINYLESKNKRPERLDRHSPIYFEYLPKELRQDGVWVELKGDIGVDRDSLKSSCLLKRLKCGGSKTSVCIVPLDGGSPRCEIGGVAIINC